VNLGGEPERDDFGLPPVDIEIPDDARELDRDVQAYRREQRALRRRLRRRRLHGPLTRDGMVLPLLAGCLVFALISAVLLTVFTATSGDDLGSRSPARPGSTAAAGTPAVGQAGGQLPDKTVQVGGRNVRLRTLTASVLALVPQGCACTAALRQLISQAAQARVTLYLVGTDGEVARLSKIAAAAGQAAPEVADDRANVLASTYQTSGLTAVLVHADGAVALASGLRPGLQLKNEFLQLGTGASPGS
jgi:hypothetical protein